MKTLDCLHAEPSIEQRADEETPIVRIIVDNTAFQEAGRLCGPEPITVGVPFGRGVWREDKDLRLVDADGAPVSTQTTVLDRWPDGSVRWALVDFQAGGGHAAQYTGQLTKPIADPRSNTQSIVIKHAAGEVRIDTGAARFVMRCGGHFPFERMSVEGVEALSPAGATLIVENEGGARCQVEVASISVEQYGPLRSVVCVAGSVHHGRNTRLEVSARLHFFSGLSTVRVALTLRNSRRALHPHGFWDLGDAGSVFLRDVSFQAAIGGPSPFQAQCSAEPGLPFERGQHIELYQDSSGGENWGSENHVNRHGRVRNSFRGYRFRAEPFTRAGFRATPLSVLASECQWVSISMPQFWQNFPKAIEAADHSIVLRLWPRQYADVHELQGGEQKTHIFYLSAGLGEFDPARVEWCRRPSTAHADPAWYRSAGLVPTVRVAAAQSHHQYFNLIQAAIEGSNSFERRREIVDEYGWRHFGDLYADHEAVRHDDAAPLTSHYNNQYDPIAGFAAEFLRTGDCRWRSLMDDLAAHVVDIDLYHTTEDKAAYSQGCFWHTNHYIDAGTATHRGYPSRGGTCGGGPSAEHNYTTGLMLHYFLTGAQASRDAVIQLADWVVAMDDGSRTRFRWLDSGPTGLASATYSSDFHGPGRGAANSINALLDAHRLTSDMKYLKKAEELVRRCIHPADDQSALGLTDPESRWSYTVFLQILGKYLEHRFELGLIDREYDYARASLLNYAQWMATHETPYLDRPEQLEFPTETWAAQDTRKAAVFEFAARHTPHEAERSRFLERAEFFFDAAISMLRASATCGLTRPVVLLLACGFQRPAPDLDDAPLPDRPAVDFGSPMAFVAYKRRLLRRALVVGAASAAAGVLLTVALLLR